MISCQVAFFPRGSGPGSSLFLQSGLQKYPFYYVQHMSLFVIRQNKLAQLYQILQA